MSLPLSGPDGRDTPDEWSPQLSAAKARLATEDSTAIAYLGDFQPGASHV